MTLDPVPDFFPDDQDFSQEADQQVCPHCHKFCDTWFDRTIDENDEMATRCEHCGGNVDRPPKDPLEARPIVVPGLAELTGKHLPGGPLFKEGEPHRSFEEAHQTFMERVQKNP